MLGKRHKAVESNTEEFRRLLGRDALIINMDVELTGYLLSTRREERGRRLRLRQFQVTTFEVFLQLWQVSIYSLF